MPNFCAACDEVDDKIGSEDDCDETDLMADETNPLEIDEAKDEDEEEEEEIDPAPEIGDFKDPPCLPEVDGAEEEI